MAKDRIMIVDDEKGMRDFLEIMLSKEGYEVFSFSRVDPAITHFKNNGCDLTITDLKIPGKDGLELLRELREIDSRAIVIMITAYASVDTAINAMKAGAYDYFTKPFNIEEIKLHINRALERRRLEKENLLLKKGLDSKYGFSKIIGTSQKMMEIYGLIMNVADTKTNVLITGESGTGKELVARAVHYESKRKGKRFVALNCGAMPENLIESELFGHQKGAFTGAVAEKKGLVELAASGTLFLDELTEMPFQLQVKLLRFIQEKTFRRVGGTSDINVDVRLIAASNRDIEQEVEEGRFREDLFYRLNVIRINVPPLRDRKQDIALLAKSFLEKYNKELSKDIKSISKDALDALVAYDYPGNVRELENALERGVALEKSGILSLKSLPAQIHADKGVRKIGGRRTGDTSISDISSVVGGVSVPPEGVDLEQTLSEFERALIEDALKKTGGVKTKAAELLGLSFRSMRYKLGKYENNDE